MALFRSLGTSDLIDLCRALRYSLSGGMMLRDAMDLLSREGTGRVRRAAARVGEDLRAGWSLQEALDKQTGVFPPLFRALAAVGEESGNLPEVMGELEKYYLAQLKNRREFVSEITWPVVQLIAAIMIIALLILVLGLIQINSPKGKPVDPLGLGLLGFDGAFTFLTYVTIVFLSIWFAVEVVRFVTRRVPFLQRCLFRVPVVGTCLRSFALTRLCISLRLMLDTRMSVLKAIRLAFAATDNAAFKAAAPLVEASIRRGNSISDSFGQTAVFPTALRSSVALAEECGRLPEMCAIQAENYDDQARRKLSLLNKILSVLIWLGVAAFIITCIFRIFTQVYLPNIQKQYDSNSGQMTLEGGSPATPVGR